MPIFRYRTLDPGGNVVTGEAAAVSAEALRADLGKQGLLVQRLQEQRNLIPWRRRRHISSEAILLLNQELIVLIRAGLTIPDALRLSAQRPDHPALTQVLVRITDDIQQGSSFSEACARHPEAFDEAYLAALRTGEKTGDLARVLQSYQDHLRQRVTLQRKVSQALAYPAFLLLTLAVILTVLFAFVLPRFVTLYSDFGAELPWPTRVLILIVDGLPYAVPAFLALGIAGVYVWLQVRQQAKVQLWLDLIKSGTPLFGGIYRNAQSAQIARTMSSLLEGGTPLVESMRITARSLTSYTRHQHLRQAARDVTEGKSLATALRANGLFPETALRLIEVGEASGGLDKMLREVAVFHEENVSHRLTRLMSLIEPILMLLVGVLVGGIIIVMYLPIFYIVDVIK